ncbi:MAG: nucleoside deaminase [Clostridiaceae bacterium]|jgi:guanine deaminase|nr:nucleoside deaminase [Clostridiaceae bacterium]
MKENDQFMRVASKEAMEGVKKGHGGPFGAVIVKDNNIIAQAHNEVIKNNDPTDHAEMIAIRHAAKELGRFDLSDCELYTSCEPCPMCLSAIHWAKIEKVYFGCTRDDAAEIGFDDKYIYDVIKGTADHQKVHLEQKDRDTCLEAFREWKAKENKVQY